MVCPWPYRGEWFEPPLNLWVYGWNSGIWRRFLGWRLALPRCCLRDGLSPEEKDFSLRRGERKSRFPIMHTAWRCRVWFRFWRREYGLKQQSFRGTHLQVIIPTTHSIQGYCQRN